MPFEPFTPDGELQRRLVDVVSALGMRMGIIDLKVAPDEGHGQFIG